QLLPSVEALRYGLLQNQLSNLSFTFKTTGPRVAIVGGMIDPVGIAVLFENAKMNTEIENAEIVFDCLSFTFRTVFTSPPSLQGDPYFQLANSLLAAPKEPTQEGLPDRLQYLEAVLKNFQIDGLIICKQSFCDPDQFEIPDTLKLAEALKIRTVRLPLDPELSDRVRIEGRLQSFLETLSIKH
ncbi:MAG: 2-hydroxyacyl-CoA dehydratase, partial [Candidatus Thorarchaeota archaeon]